MNKEQFWQIITASQNKKRDCEKQAAKLEKLLLRLSAEEILGFENVFTSLLNESYRWDLWGAAYVINGGCSDDGFEYFRYWLIAQGQAYFEAAMQDHERAGDAAGDEQDVECEDIRYATRQAYFAKTGRHLWEVADATNYPAEPLGNPWTEDELETLFPRLYERFG